MKILHLGNVANDANNIVRGLRGIGVDAHLFIQRPCHVTRCPQWEEANIDAAKLHDLDDPDWKVLNEHWTPPPYMHVHKLKRPRLFGRPIPLSRTIGRIITRPPDLGEYDLLVAHAPFAECAPGYRKRYGRPYLVYDSGWIRYLYNPYYERHYRRTARARFGYENAARILFTNVDTYDMFLDHGYLKERLVFSPFAIDMSLYKPKPSRIEPNGHHPIFFSPARQDWPEKGNQLLLYAFQRYLKRRPHAILYLADWGQPPGMFDDNDYLAMSKKLVQQLAIEESVRWLPLLPKRELVEYYNLADIVFDQYVFGAAGTTCMEAMSCGRPVVSFINESLWTRWHRSAPPVANAATMQTIYAQMIELEDDGCRWELGEKGQAWVKENSELTVVARRHLETYKEVLDGSS